MKYSKKTGAKEIERSAGSIPRYPACVGPNGGPECQKCKQELCMKEDFRRSMWKVKDGLFERLRGKWWSNDSDHKWDSTSLVIFASISPTQPARGNQQALYIIKDACTTSRISSLMSSDKILTCHILIIHAWDKHGWITPHLTLSPSVPSPRNSFSPKLVRDRKAKGANKNTRSRTNAKEFYEGVPQPSAFCVVFLSSVYT